MVNIVQPVVVAENVIVPLWVKLALLMPSYQLPNTFNALVPANVPVHPLKLILLQLAVAAMVTVTAGLDAVKNTSSAEVGVA